MLRLSRKSRYSPCTSTIARSKVIREIYNTTSSRIFSENTRTNGVSHVSGHRTNRLIQMHSVSCDFVKFLLRDIRV